MSKKLVLCLALLTMGMGVLGCFPPIYSTAKIDQGFHCDIGMAANASIAGGGGIGRIDSELRYGFSDYFQIHCCAGVIFPAGPVLPIYRLGLQTAVPLKSVTPAFRVEFTPFPTYLAPTLLLGLGQNEFLTLGGRVNLIADPHIYVFPDAFITGHLWSRLSIFAGVELFHFDEPMLHGMPVFTLGVGYKIK